MKFALSPRFRIQEQACKIVAKPTLPVVLAKLAVLKKPIVLTTFDGLAKALFLSIVCLFFMLGVGVEPLSAEALSQSNSNAATSNTSRRSPAGSLDNANIEDSLTELLEMVNLPANCELENKGTVPEFFIGERPFSGSYSIWRGCENDLPFLGLFWAQPSGDEGTLILLKRALEDADDLILFQLALSEQLQQKVIWGATGSNNASAEDVIETSDELVDSSRESDVLTSTAADAAEDAAAPSPSNETPAPTMTDTDSAQLSATSISTPTATVTATLVTTQEEAALQEASGPAAIIEIESLNMRSGPGVNYPRLGIVSRGDLLEITGKVGNCSWIQFRTPSGIYAWISGGPQFVRLVGDCTAIPRVQPPPVPTPTPSRDSEDASNLEQSSAETDPDKGCYLIENFLRAKLTFTLTRSTDGWSRTFIVPVHAEQLECFEPGPYTYTIDAPPPWNSINGKLDVAPGDELRWAVGGE